MISFLLMLKCQTVEFFVWFWVSKKKIIILGPVEIILCLLELEGGPVTSVNIGIFTVNLWSQNPWWHSSPEPLQVTVTINLILACLTMWKYFWPILNKYNVSYISTENNLKIFRRSDWVTRVIQSQIFWILEWLNVFQIMIW